MPIARASPRGAGAAAAATGLSGNASRLASEETANKGLVTSIYEAFGRGDIPFIISKLKNDARFDFAVAESDVPWHLPASGPSGVPMMFKALGENVTFEQFAPVHFIASGDDVVAHIRTAYTINRNGKRVEQDQLHWWTLRDGMVARLRHYEDTAQVVAAWRG